MHLSHRLLRANLPTAALIALLQRAPVVRIATLAEEGVLASSVGSILKSAVAVAAAVGAIDTLAGATTIVASPVSPLSLTVGQSTNVAFGVTGTQAPPSSWRIGTGSVIPAGMNFQGLTSPGVVNVTSLHGTALMSGAPTLAGTFRMSITAYENPNGQGSSTPTLTYTVVVNAPNAPSFTTQPASQTANVGATVSFTAAATGSPTYQWQFGGSNLNGQTGATLTLTNVQLGAAGSYTVLATNAGGSTMSAAATLTVLNPNAPPVFSIQPQSQTVSPGTNLTFTAAASGSPSYQWQLNGGNIVGATSATYSITNVQPANAGTYQVVATSAGLSTTSSAATLTIDTTPVMPFFAISPAPQTIASGSTVVFNAQAGGYPLPTYAWQKNGAPIPGATSATYIISGATSASVGNYSCIATNSAGSVPSSAAALTVTSTADPGRLVNLSILSRITGTLSMGFVNGGNGTSGSEPLLIRAIGPSIGPGTLFNVPGVMPDPSLKVLQQSNGATMGANAGWGVPAGNASAVLAADAATGAFPLTDTTSLDSAVVVNLLPVGGGYGAQVSGKSGDGGFALTEIYDDTATYTAASPRLINLSCLTTVAAGGALNVGFVVGGSTAKTVLVRVAGPSIAAPPFNVPGTMPDPELTVTAQSAPVTVLASNTGWGGDAAIAATAAQLGAFAFTSALSKDSAALVTLPAVGGGYSVTVSSASGAGGAVLVEVYEVP